MSKRGIGSYETTSGNTQEVQQAGSEVKTRVASGMLVEHDPVAHRFTLAVPSGTAQLLYAPAGSGILEYYSTYVPAADRGQGLGGRLVAAAVEYARAERLRIIQSCWYVAQWLREHPEHSDLIVG
jgi:uncharacterized protein